MILDVMIFRRILQLFNDFCLELYSFSVVAIINRFG